MSRKWFTLIELLVVVSIIAILAAMLLPALTRARGAARQAACINNLKQISLAMPMYEDDNGGWLPAAGQDNPSGGWQRYDGHWKILLTGRRYRTHSDYLGIPVTTGDHTQVSMPNPLLCPDANNGEFSWDRNPTAEFWYANYSMNGLGVYHLASDGLTAVMNPANPTSWKCVKNAASATQPDDTILILDGREETPGLQRGWTAWIHRYYLCKEALGTRHDDRHSILFMDGHAGKERIDNIDYAPSYGGDYSRWQAVR